MSKNGAGRLAMPIWEDNWADDCALYRHLLAGVLLLAWRDATNGRNAQHRAAAIDWLRSGGADNVCSWLGLDVDAVWRK